MIYGIVASEELISTVVPAAAVTIDNYNSETRVSVASQTVTNSRLFTASFWARCDDLSDNPKFFDLGNANSWIGFLSGTLRCHLEDTTGLGIFTFGASAGSFSASNWHHVFISADTNHAANSKLCNIYIDGNDVHYDSSKSDDAAAFDIAMNGRGFAISEMTQNHYAIIDYSDVWIAVGQYLDPATYLTAFRTPSGDRTNLGVFGQIPTGTIPTYFFTGGASTFGINCGSGDAVSVTGMLLNALSNP